MSFPKLTCLVKLLFQSHPSYNKPVKLSQRNFNFKSLFLPLRPTQQRAQWHNLVWSAYS